MLTEMQNLIEQLYIETLLGDKKKRCISRTTILNQRVKKVLRLSYKQLCRSCETKINLDASLRKVLQKLALALNWHNLKYVHQRLVDYLN